MYRQHSESILNTSSERHLALNVQYKKTIDFFQSKLATPEAIAILKDEFLIHAEYILFKTKRLPQNLKLDFYKQSIKYLERERSKKIKSLQVQINSLQESEKQQKTLMGLIRKVTKLSLVKHPIKKYKAYKSMLKTYFKIRRSQK